MTILTGVISYPRPAFQNLPIHAEYYIPSEFAISNVSLGLTTLITTIKDLNYVIGQEIRLIIPPSFGCRQLNEKRGYVLSIPSPNQVQVSVDSSQNVDPYIASSDTTVTAQILAIGNVNSGATNFHGRNCNLTFIPGSFRDISPKGTP
jgi:hypothetical protein